MFHKRERECRVGRSVGIRRGVRVRGRAGAVAAEYFGQRGDSARPGDGALPVVRTVAAVHFVVKTVVLKRVRASASQFGVTCDD